MAGQILDGNRIRDQILAELTTEIQQTKNQGITPGLVAVLVGNNPASQVYVRNKIKACKQVGIYSETIEISPDTSQEDLLALVESLNERQEIDGILVQLPLPDQINTTAVLEAISPEKDVDGFHPVNTGKLVAGEPSLVPCTPKGLIEILKRSNIPIAGKHAVIVGRSNIVGKPAALLLLQEHATITVCHSKTPDLSEVCQQADILVAAIGRPAMLTGDYIREGAVVLDVGINRLTDAALVEQLFRHDPERLQRFRKTGKTLVGDIHPRDVQQKSAAYTPVPGGVGPLTIAMLMSNTLQAAKRRIQPNPHELANSS